MNAKEFGEALKEEKYKLAIEHADNAGCGSLYCAHDETPLPRARERYWNLIRAWELDPAKAAKYWNDYVQSRASH